MCQFFAIFASGTSDSIPVPKHLLTYIVFALSYLCMGAYNYDPSLHQQEVAGGERYTIVHDYLVHDYLGTPTEAYDADGNQVWGRVLDMDGRVIEETGNVGMVPFLFQGQYYDRETGLAYNRFRYYDPSTGAYISQDPIGLAGGILNLYGYVEDPNSWIDAYGLQKSYGPKKKIGIANGNSKKRRIAKLVRDINARKKMESNLNSSTIMRIYYLLIMKEDL